MAGTTAGKLGGKNEGMDLEGSFIKFLSCEFSTKNYQNMQRGGRYNDYFDNIFLVIFNLHHRLFIVYLILM